jgi:N-acetyl-alpha-D-muramate 1-phosphate uridylyltransferase
MTGRRLQIAILAGGLATRLRPLTEQLPKSLVPVLGQPFVAHQLRLLKAHGFERVVLCVGYLGEQVEAFVGDGADFGLEVRFSYDGPTLLGTAGALRRALPLLDRQFFVLYGDSYLPCSYRAVQEAFVASGKAALMTVFNNQDRWDRSNVDFRDGKIVRYDKAAPDAGMGYIDYGLGVLPRDVLEAVPDARAVDLAEVYRALLAAGQLAGFEVHERFYEVGSRAGIAALSAYLRRAELP